MYVLSWYEGINLDMLKIVCDGSKWTTDPDLIRRRQETAYPLIQYAPVHIFVTGPRVPQAEEIADVDEGEEEDEESVDEEIEADTPPETATGTAAESTTEKASAEVSASPSTTKAPDSAV